MTPTRMSKIEAALRTVLAFTEARNRHDVDGMVQLLGEDCVLEHFSPAPDGTAFTGKGAVSQFWRESLRGLPRAQIEVEEIFSLGERCILRWRSRWEAGAGDEALARGVDIFLVRGGVIREQLSYVKG